MTEGVIGRRYAHALFLAAVGKGEVDQVEEDLFSLRQIWEENPGLARLLENPELELRERTQFLDRVFPDGLTDLVRRFLDFLLEKKRIGGLLDVVSVFHDLAEARRGCCEARVTTRGPLEPEHRDRIARALGRLVGLDVCLIEDIDPEVIGGVRVMMKDRVIDRTIRAQLVQLRENLLAARILGR